MALPVWSYAGRLAAVRKQRRYTDFARVLAQELGMAVTPTHVKNWESGRTPRFYLQVEAWIRKQEAPKPLPTPRPSIGFSFAFFLDTGTIEEARNIEATLLGIVRVLRARWPDPEPAPILHGLSGTVISHPPTATAIAECPYCEKTGDSGQALQDDPVERT